jgi:negative regulator of flagellin synthesis FlgM
MANEISGIRAPALQPAQARPVANALVQGQSQASSDRAAADTVTLTDSARLMQRLEAAVAQAPRVDSKRIEELKQQIASGAYKVDANQVATSFAQLESDLAEPQRDIVASRTENGYTYTQTMQTPNGTRERTVTVGYDEATGMLSRDTTWTSADGQQVSRHGEIQRTDDGYMKSVSVTRADGETVSRQLDVSFDPESKSLTRVVTVDGENHDYTRTTRVAHDESGELIHKSITRPTENGLT